MENNFQSNHALKFMQHDLNMALNLSNVSNQHCPITATVNEVFKRSKKSGLGDLDTSAIYLESSTYTQ